MRLWYKKEKFFTKDYFGKKKYEIGDFTYGKPKISEFDSSAKLKIGKFCSIAKGVRIFLGGNHRIDWITTYPFQFPEGSKNWPETSQIKGHPATKGDVIIGNDVWLAHGVLILSGVTIGDGAVIGAGAVVTKNVEPYTIVVGNPAKFLKKRFNDEVIDMLLEIRWWDWSEEKIRRNLDVLCSPHIEQLYNVDQLCE